MPTARTAAELGKAYLDALQAQDRDEMLALLAEDFTLEMPCNVSGTNDLSGTWVGLETARTNIDAGFRAMQAIKLVDLEITQAAGADIAFAEGLGDMTTASGRPYNNRYVFRFDAENGKIKRVREYINPVTAAISFGLPLPSVA
jgi:ketosteroid isomerase-like protein